MSFYRIVVWCAGGMYPRVGRTRSDAEGRLTMKKCANHQPDTPGQEYHWQALNNYAKASLTLFVVAVVIVLLDIVGPSLLSSGHDIIRSISTLP